MTAISMYEKPWHKSQRVMGSARAQAQVRVSCCLGLLHEGDRQTSLVEWDVGNGGAIGMGWVESGIDDNNHVEQHLMAVTWKTESVDPRSPQTLGYGKALRSSQLGL
jgi:hypothetical protein